MHPASFLFQKLLYTVLLAPYYPLICMNNKNESTKLTEQLAQNPHFRSEKTWYIFFSSHKII